MGLDMYLRGEKYCWTDWQKPENNRKEDGFKVRSLELELGYWRKHPNLHGFIIKEFGGGVDECQRIDLSVDDCLKIIKAIQEDSLPHTEGFFFGDSAWHEEHQAEYIKVFEKAIEWQREETKEPRIARSIFYQASW